MGQWNPFSSTPKAEPAETETSSSVSTTPRGSEGSPNNVATPKTSLRNVNNKLLGNRNTVKFAESNASSTIVTGADDGRNNPPNARRKNSDSDTFKIGGNDLQESSERMMKGDQHDKQHRVQRLLWSSFGFSANKSWYFRVESFLGSLWNFLSQLFASPLQKDPIFFTRAEVPKVAFRIGTGASFYDEATKELIDGVFEERREKIKGHEALNWLATIDLENYPEWNQDKIEILWDKFQVLDVNGDSRISFAELCEGLDRIGNTTSKSARKAHFNTIDIDHSGSLDFDEFCMMAYNLEKSDHDTINQALFDLYKSLDRDVSMIRNLSVIEQLQSGLF